MTEQKPNGRINQAQRKALARIALEEMDKKATAAVHRQDTLRAKVTKSIEKREGIDKIRAKIGAMKKKVEALEADLWERGWRDRYNPMLPDAFKAEVDSIVNAVVDPQTIRDRGKRLEVELLMAKTREDAKKLIAEALAS